MRTATLLVSVGSIGGPRSQVRAVTGQRRDPERPPRLRPRLRPRSSTVFGAELGTETDGVVTRGVDDGVEDGVDDGVDDGVETTDDALDELGASSAPFLAIAGAAMDVVTAMSAPPTSRRVRVRCCMVCSLGRMESGSLLEPTCGPGRTGKLHGTASGVEASIRLSSDAAATGTSCSPRCCGADSLLAPLGDVAQLAEHLLCKQGVDGSIPFVSTGGNGAASAAPFFFPGPRLGRRSGASLTGSLSSRCGLCFRSVRLLRSRLAVPGRPAGRSSMRR
jgi:hypothetical protein